MPRQLKTNRLFYKKWPYKVCCVINGASHLIRASNTSQSRLMMGGSWATYGKNHINYNPEELREFFAAVSPFLRRTDVKSRVEGRHFNIFCGDVGLLNQITTALNPWITEIHSPNTATELDFILENGHKAVLCDDLPHGRYMYKVIFKHTTTRELRQKFYLWSRNYGDRFNVSKNNTEWFLGRRGWVQTPFIYTEDSQLLTMVGMFMGDSVQSVTKFITRDSINTELEQEMSCQP
jgi:hypothetical protein